MSKLKGRGIETAIHYPFCLSNEIGKLDNVCPNAEWISEHVVSLPFGPHLTEKEISYITDMVREI